MSQISVTINGKTYRMACDEGQENHLIQLGQKFDGYVGQLKGSFGEIGDQRLTIMAGIMVVDELSELQKKVLKLEADLENLSTSRDSALLKCDAQSKSVTAGLGNAAERLEVLARKLNGL
jgi:cell division protein ZapA